MPKYAATTKIGKMKKYLYIGQINHNQMKRVALLFAVIAASVLSFSSCEKATVLSVDQQLLTFNESGGSQIIALTANKPWTASSDQGWCKVTPSAGEDAANSRISINCDPNTTYDTRYCNITFTCAELTKTVSVTQDESEGMLISQTDFDISNEAQQVSVEVKANVKFSVAVDDACKSWIRHSATKGLTMSTVILDISKNEDYDGREGRVTISQTDGSLFSTIKIRQSQNNGLFITTSEYELSNESHQLSIEVKSNINFEVSSGASWIKYVETKSLNTSFIVLDIEANQDYDKREGKVIVKQKGGGLEGMITIKQDQNYGLLISKTEYDLSNVAQTIDVEIKHNVDFDVVIPADCKGWISKVNTKGLETSTLTFSVAKNESYNNREGSITFKQKNGPLSGTVKVTQAQTDSIQVEKELYTIDHKGGNVEVNVKANVDYESTVEDAAKDWLSVVGTKAMDPSKITLSVIANESEQPREGKVYVKQPNGSAETSFTVKQTGKNTITAAFHDFAASSVGDTFVIDVESTVEIEVVIPKDATWLTQVTTKAATTKTLTFQVATNKMAKARVATVQFVNQKEGLSDTVRVEQNPVNVPISNEILYTSTDGSIVTPFQADAFGSTIVSNTVIDGKGSIRFEKPLKLMGEKAFYNRLNLKSIVLPEGLVEIRGSAFDNCIWMETITLPLTITTLGNSVFRNCRSVVFINLPSITGGIPHESFMGCSNLQTVVLPTSLSGDIGTSAFSQCSSLLSIVIPNGVRSLGSYAFYRCSSLSSIRVPEGVEEISWDCFRECTKLKEITLPSTLTSIGDAVFNSCVSIKEIKLPDGLTELGGGVFQDCTNLSGIEIPDGVAQIKASSFSSCVNLTSIKLPSHLTKLDLYALDRTGLKSVSIPNSVIEIGPCAFEECKQLETVSLSSAITTISNNTFAGCSALKTITLHEGLLSIEKEAFSGCESLTSIKIPASVNNLGSGVFGGCKKLASANIPTGIRVLQAGLFQSCSSLKSIEIPNSIERIEDRVFYSCEELTSIKIPESVLYIGNDVFRDCHSLTSANIPKGITSISAGLFWGCTSLKTIEIPNSIERIGEWAFSGCKSLTAIVIPEKVTFLGTNVFHSCIGLTKATVLPKTPPTCENNGAFYNTNECPIYVPKTSVETYKKTGFWKEWAHRIQAIP